LIIRDEWEEHALRVFENRAFRAIFGPKREVSQEDGENCVMRSFIIRTVGNTVH
jgi:hypothetical protein